MEKIFEIASNISTPLALSGLLAVIFFFILKQIIAKDIFPTLTKGRGFDIIRIVINRLFILSIFAMILGFIGYILPIVVSISDKHTDDASQGDIRGVIWGSLNRNLSYGTNILQ